MQFIIYTRDKTRSENVIRGCRWGTRRLTNGAKRIWNKWNENSARAAGLGAGRVKWRSEVCTLPRVELRGRARSNFQFAPAHRTQHFLCNVFWLLGVNGRTESLVRCLDVLFVYRYCYGVEHITHNTPSSLSRLSSLNCRFRKAWLITIISILQKSKQFISIYENRRMKV